MHDKMRIGVSIESVREYAYSLYFDAKLWMTNEQTIEGMPDFHTMSTYLRVL